MIRQSQEVINGQIHLLIQSSKFIYIIIKTQKRVKPIFLDNRDIKITPILPHPIIYYYLYSCHTIFRCVNLLSLNRPVLTTCTVHPTSLESINGVSLDDLNRDMQISELKKRLQVKNKDLELCLNCTFQKWAGFLSRTNFNI